jgi:vacuolar-type H+-ATPase subunit I/STV1
MIRVEFQNKFFKGDGYPFEPMHLESYLRVNLTKK